MPPKTKAADVFNSHVELENGQSATLRDPKTLKNGDRKQLLFKMDAATTDLTRGLVMKEGLVALLVESWTLDLALPKDNLSSLDELSIHDSDVLDEICGEAGKALFPRVDPNPDPESPTKVSAA